MPIQRRVTWPFAGLAAAVVVTALPARADNTACLKAASDGQSLRDTHKPIEARDQFRICAAQECPALVRGDCAGWLEGIQKAIPSVVLIARDGHGGSVTDVAVQLDGHPLPPRLDGDAVPVDPGQHVFHFQRSDGTSLDQTFVVAEGVQSQQVVASFGGGTDGSAPAEVVAPRPSPWRTVGWVAGGVGLAGLVVGTIFGVVAISDHSNAACNAQDQCLGGPLSDAKSAANISDVGLIAGGVLVAGGAALVLFAPKATNNEHVAIRLSPLAGAGQGGMMVSGRW